MNTEIQAIVTQLRDHFSGDPWYGRSSEELLNEVDEGAVFEQPAGGHSILELLWHMITWKEFVLSRLGAGEKKNIHYFEEYDWRTLDHANKNLWPQGLAYFGELHQKLVEEIGKQNDSLLTQQVAERTYDFRKLLHGIIEHDVYHLGQIAILNKMYKGGRAL